MHDGCEWVRTIRIQNSTWYYISPENHSLNTVFFDLWVSTPMGSWILIREVAATFQSQCKRELESNPKMVWLSQNWVLDIVLLYSLFSLSFPIATKINPAQGFWEDSRGWWNKGRRWVKAGRLGPGKFGLCSYCREVKSPTGKLFWRRSLGHFSLCYT